MHELEGAKIAREILQNVGYGEKSIREIVVIIEGHDSRNDGRSVNDRIVKDADKLWRYSKEAIEIDMKRFEQTHEEALERIRSNLTKWFFTNSARAMAGQELMAREKCRGRDQE